MFLMRNKENSFPIHTLIWRPVNLLVDSDVHDASDMSECHLYETALFLCLVTQCFTSNI